MVSKFLTAKLAVAVLTAVVAVGGVATAAGVAKSASEHAKAKAVGKVDKAEKAAGERGPDASGSAKAGLCRAWAAGDGGDNGGKAESTAFEALARAAGGADKVAGFCADASREAAKATTDKPEGAGATERPEASAAALDGMCKAWASGKGGDMRQQASDVAFASLVEAAGGAANVSAFCAARTAAGEAGQAEAGQDPGSTADEKRSEHAPDRADQNRPATEG